MGFKLAVIVEAVLPMFKVLDDVHHGLRVLCQLQLLLPVL